jgi:hypothetical protein
MPTDKILHNQAHLNLMRLEMEGLIRTAQEMMSFLEDDKYLTDFEKADWSNRIMQIAAIGKENFEQISNTTAEIDKALKADSKTEKAQGLLQPA